MEAPRPRRPRRRRATRSSFLYSAALIGIAGGATLASGQTIGAFNGFGNVVLGNVTIGPNNSSSIVVDSPKAIIDWNVPTEGNQTVTFGNANTVATFTTNSQSAYTVLNRVYAGGNPIEFDGRVESQVLQGGQLVRGGNVWFYSPGGIILGNGSSFDVGSLILTTSAIDTGGDTTLPDPASGIAFARGDIAPGQIVVQQGATITASQPGSYVALVSPIIQQGGTVSVNGSVGYIAASDATVTINAGLFSISNAVGVDVANGGSATPLTHTGTTTGPAATAGGTPHRIYLVTVPANDAVTMLVQGSLGYQPAADAAVENGQVVLLAGYTPTGADAAEVPTQIDTARLGAISIPGGTTTTSKTIAYASGDTTVETSQGDISLAGFTSTSNGNFGVHASEGRRIESSGDFDIRTIRSDASAPIAINVDSGGTLAVAGFLQAARSGADGQALTMTVNGTVTAGSLGLTTSRIAGARAATGGTTTLAVTGGTLTVAGDTYIAAIGYGGIDEGGGQLDSTGGTAALTVSSGGTASLHNTRFDVSGADPGIAPPAAGGTARGGTGTISVSGGGTLTLAGTLAIEARAAGRTTADAAAQSTGGTIGITADGGTIQQTGTGAIALSADASGGTATGGTITIQAMNGGTLATAGAATMLASGTGIIEGGTSPATGTGGHVSFTADGGTLAMAGGLAIDATGRGSAPVTSGTPPVTTRGGDATGGLVELTADDGGTLRLGIDEAATAVATVSVDASGLAGGTGALAGSGTGGTIFASTDRDAAASFGAATLALGGSSNAGALTLQSANTQPDEEGPAFVIADVGPVVPSAPLSFASLAVTNTGVAGEGGMIKIVADKPISVTGDASLTGGVPIALSASGPGVLTVGGTLTASGTTIAATQSDGDAGVNPLVVGNAAFTSLAGDIQVASLIATGTVAASSTGGGIGIASPAGLHFTSLATTGGDATIRTAGALTIDAATIDGILDASSGDAFAGGTLAAAGDVDLVANGDLTATSLSSARGTVDLTMGGAAGVDAISAGDGISIAAGTTARFGTLVAGTYTASPDNDGGVDFGSIGIQSTGTITVGSATAFGSIGLGSQNGGVSATTLTAGAAGAVAVVAGGDVSLGQVTAPRFLYIGNPSVADGGDGGDGDPTTSSVIAAIAAAGPTRAGGAVTIGNASAGTAQIGASGGIGITGTLATTGGTDASGDASADLSLDAGGAIRGGTIAAGGGDGSIVATAGGITLLGATAALDATLRAGGAISVGQLAAGRDGDVRVAGTSGGVAIAGATIGDDFRVLAPGALTIGTLTMTGTANGTPPGGPGYAGNSAFLRAGSIAIDGATLANGTVDATATAGDIRFGALSTGNTNGSADGHVSLTATGAVVASGLAPFGTVTASGSSVSLTAVDTDLRVAGATARAGGISIASAGGIAIQGPLSATNLVTLQAVRDVTAGDLTLPGGLSATSTQGRIAVGAVDTRGAAGGILLSGQAGVGAGALTAAGAIALASGGAIATGDIASVGGLVGANAGGGLTLGGVQAAGSILLASGGAVSTRDLAAGAGTLLPGGGVTPATISIDTTAGTGAIATGTLSAEAVDVRGGGAVTTGTLSVADRGSGAGGGYTTVLRAVGTLSTGAIDGTGDVTLASATGDISTGTIATRGGLDARAGGMLATGRIDAGSDVTLVAASGLRADTISARGAVSISAGGDAALADVAAGGAVTVGAGGALTTGQITGGGAIALTAAGPIATGAVGTSAAVNVASRSDITLAGVTAGAVAISAGGDVVLADVGAGGTLTTISGGALTTGQLTGGGAISLTAVGPIGTGAVGTSAAANVASRSDVTLGGVTAGSAAVDAGGALATGRIDAGGDVTLAAASGLRADAISAQGAVSISAGGDAALAGVAAGGAVSVGAGGALAAGPIAGGGAVALTAGGLLTLGGAVSGPTIGFASGDIAIAPGAAIGGAGTTSVSFAATSGRMYVGDNSGAPSGAYLLDAAELGRVQAGSIFVASSQAPAAARASRVLRIGAAAGGGADLTIGDLTLAAGSAGQILDPNGALVFSAPGSIALVGGLALTNAGAGNAVRLTAGGDITGTLPAAGIAVTGADGGLAGTLALSANRILFASADAAAAVGAATPATASDRLAANDGFVATGGYLRADSVGFTVGQALYTQNSGASAAVADRAGVAAGGGGIRIASLGGGPIDLVLNGRIANPAASGADVVAAVAARSGGIAFSAGSTINGCPAGGASCAPPVDTGGGGGGTGGGTDNPGGGTGGTGPTVPVSDQINRLIQPVQDVVQQVDLPSGLGNSAPYRFDMPALVSLIDLAPLVSAPSIDGPVTGAGNDDLWVGVGVGRELGPMGGAKDAGPGK